MNDDFVYEICGSECDQEILQLLESTPIEGNVDMVFTARPSFIDAQTQLGESSFIIGIRHRYSGRLIGILSILIQPRYLAGRVYRIGYLSHLRVDRNYRGRQLVKNGLMFLRKHMCELPADFYFTSIGIDNLVALRVLASGKPGYPTLTPLGEVASKFFLLRRNAPLPNTYTLSTLSSEDYEEANDFLSHESRKKNLYPYYHQFWQTSLPTKYFVVAKHRNTIAGLLAVWNQNSFKQIILHRYRFPMNFFKTIFNTLAYTRGLPPLPKARERLHFSYISHVAVKNNDSNVLRAMLAFVQNNYHASHFAVIGLHDRDPLCGCLKELLGITYRTQLYAVSWQNQSILTPELSNSLLYPEIALL